MAVADVQMHLVELLLQAEKKAKCTTPVNCYRKYLGQISTSNVYSYVPDGLVHHIKID